MMSYLTYLLTGILILRGLAIAAEAPRGRVTLEQAKSYAIANNFEIAALKRAVEEAGASQSRALSAFYPHLRLEGGLDYENTTTGDTTVGVALAYAEYNLFRGFRDKYTLSASERGTEIARVRLEKARLRVGTEVEAAFHRYLFQKTSIKIYTTALDLNKKHLAMAKKRRKSGLVSNSDVMEFNIRRSLLNSEVVSLKQQLEIARIDLKKLLGQEIGGKIEPVGELQHQHLEGTLMDYLGRIQKENEEVLVRTKAVEKADFEKRRTASHFFPEITLEVRAGYENLHDRPPQGGAIVGGQLLAKIDLFSGFDTVSERREGTARLLKEEGLLKQAILNAVTGTERAYRKIKSIQERVDLEEKNEDRARKFYRSVLGEYKRGVKNSSDVKGAAELYVESMLRREGFKYEFLVEKLHLERILGGEAKVSVMKPGGHNH